MIAGSSSAPGESGRTAAAAAERRARLQAERLERDGAPDAAALWRRVVEEIRRQADSHPPDGCDGGGTR
jgi:hypothetical protein